MSKFYPILIRVQVIWFSLVFIQVSNAQIIFPDCPPDEVVCIESTICEADLFIAQHPATTNCMTGSNIIYSYESDFGNGNLPIDGATVIGFPIGIHSILIKAEDECMNSAWCTYNVEIADCKKPTPYCKNGIVVELIAGTCEVLVWASDFNEGSFDNCPGQLQFSFSSDTDFQSITYDLDDFGQNTVDMWVTDEAGNQDFCTTYVIVQDPGDCDFGGEVSVSGRFHRDDDSPIENAKAFCLACAPTDLMYSDQDGAYEFSNIPAGGDYFILPEKESPFVEGVTVLDVIKIRSHILAIDALTPTRLVAGDINVSGGITAFDVVLMQKLILGVDTVFGSVPSWIIEPNGINLNNLFVDKTDADFLGIKMGDVIFESEVPKENVQPKFIAQPAQVAVGSTVDLAIKVEDFDNIQGFQFGIQYDTNVLSYNEVSSQTLPNFNTSFFPKMKPGLINIAWLNPNHIGVDLADGSVVLSLNFDVIGTPSNDMPLTFDFSYVPPQVVLGGCALADPIFEDGTIQVGTNDFENIGLNVALLPNPINQNEDAFLLIESEKPQDLNIEIFDTNSKLLSKNPLNIISGTNDFKLKTPQNAGVYFVKITTQKGINKTLKLIVL